ncbi:2OG-Fe(II) oxygenase [Nocardioides sp.]|uniref:2OG-Fe(II) oxygenase n=1 Tax=Nocardioides sp. TaxID=35761 RepID=UPI002B93C646|nr:2OG-Fe(II) oxygenase [Nocardioides sp.]HXH78170.1 2OG-Fe(II) oxygenase [Nocardioides sp.]
MTYRYRADDPTPIPSVMLPDEGLVNQTMRMLPDWMHPAQNPFGMVFEGYLTDETCDEMVSCIEDDETYSVQRCGAQTRQYEREQSSHAAALEEMARLVRRVNDSRWNYVVDHDPAAWLQTYTQGGDYHAHQDNSPGQSRKLSAVALISDPADYEGGDLTIRAIPEVGEYVIPRTRGTVVVFQPWLVHDVSTVTAGTRRTVNMGFWGPPLR